MNHDILIQNVVNEIVQLFSPKRIYLFSQKINIQGSVTSFKLVIVSEHADSLEHDIYLQVDSPIPFDVVVYTPEEWESLSQTEHSFASRVKKNGEILYE